LKKVHFNHNACHVKRSETSVGPNALRIARSLALLGMTLFLSAPDLELPFAQVRAPAA
jgi:hypothetical protein